MKKKIDLVMFDLDGTLADTGHDLADAVNYTRAHFNLPALAEATVYSHVGRGVEHLLRHALPERSASQFPAIMKVFLARYESHLLDRTQLYPQVCETLDYFQNKRRVLVSNKIYRLAVQVVEGLGVAERFDAIFGGDSAAEKKPHPALLQAVLTRFQVAPELALMVGDSDIDIEAGRRAGVQTCGVTYGLGDRAAMLAAEPDYVVDQLNDLHEYFD